MALLLLAGFLLVQLGRNDARQWAARQGDRVTLLVEALSSRVQPQFSVVSIPPGQNPDDPLVAQALQANQQGELTVNNPTDLLPVAPRPDVASAVTETVGTAAAGGAAGGDLTSQETGGAALEAPIVEDAATSVAEATAELVMTATSAPTATPVATATALPPTATPTATPAPAAAGTVAATIIATADVTASVVGASSTVISATPVTSPTGEALPATPATRVAAGRPLASTRVVSVTATITATPSQTVSLLGLLTPTPSPALVPTVAPTPASAPVVLAVYEVRQGDTLFDIARQYDLTVDDLLAANNLTADDVYTIQPGDELNIPAPTPEGAPTATPGAAPSTYTVRSGDTILAIALRLDLTMDELLAANNLTINDARGLQPGDVLTLPGVEPAVEPTAASTLTPTLTPAATATATAQPSPTTAEVALRVDAPRLRSPENGAAVSCSAPGTLNWLAVTGMRPTDIYVVHLGYVNDIGPDGVEKTIWVISQQQPAPSTSWTLDGDLCGLAPVTQGRQWRWYVEVAEKGVDGLRPVSPASPVWGFAWQ